MTYCTNQAISVLTKAIEGSRLDSFRSEGFDQRASNFTMSFCSWRGSEKYKDHFEAGIYVCSKCGHELFSAKSKYKHHTPWPAFSETVKNDSVSKVDETEPQTSSRAKALKVSCGKCGNGLGHEFLRDGPDGRASRF